MADQPCRCALCVALLGLAVSAERGRLARLGEPMPAPFSLLSDPRVSVQRPPGTSASRPHRRRFGARVLERYPLTQPADECKRCGIVGDGPLELDHMVELVAGGADHPHNLVRLCSACHRAKPYFNVRPLVEWRLAVISWVQSGHYWYDAIKRDRQRRLYEAAAAR